MSKNKTDTACLGEGCMDDLCRDSGVCLVNDWPLSERCASCGHLYNWELGEECACEPDDRLYWGES